MAHLIHWDFSPGLKLADQVHAKFGSTVHYSSSSGTKEFFLVVSFSSASFPLSVDSVALALQCCLGGSASGFNVLQLSGRCFRFSVASNRVGHFIYALRDRIWPDFVCHFWLFKQHVDYSSDGSGWHSDLELGEIVARSPVAIKTSLDFLEAGAQKDDSGALELAKFGFIRDVKPIRDDNLAAVQSQLPSTKVQVDHVNPMCLRFGSFMPHTPLPKNLDQNVCFGSFPDPFMATPASKGMLHFEGLDFRSAYWQGIPDSTLYNILDTWQAGHSNAEVMQILSLKSIPSEDFIYSKLKRCHSCFRIGHTSEQCQGTSCVNCLTLGFTCDSHDRGLENGAFCTKCLANGHLNADCVIGPRCKICSLLGH